MIFLSNSLCSHMLVSCSLVDVDVIDHAGFALFYFLYFTLFLFFSCLFVCSLVCVFAYCMFLYMQDLLTESGFVESIVGLISRGVKRLRFLSIEDVEDAIRNASELVAILATRHATPFTSPVDSACCALVGMFEFLCVPNSFSDLDHTKHEYLLSLMSVPFSQIGSDSFLILFYCYNCIQDIKQ